MGFEGILDMFCFCKTDFFYLVRSVFKKAMRNYKLALDVGHGFCIYGLQFCQLSSCAGVMVD